MRKFSKEGIQVSHISWSAVTWFFSLLISVVYLAGVRTNGDNWKDTVNADGNGYYAYLPAAFIYGDFQYKFAPDLICEYNSLCSENGPYFCNKVNDRYVNKYFVGVSVAISPFWLPMSAVSSWGNYKHDGYSFVFKLSVSLAGLFYAFAALWVLRKILRRFLIEDHLIAVLIPVFYFGTNLFHYTLHEPSMSHVYSFAFVTFFLWQWCRLIDNHSRKRLSLLGLLFGMVLIIRPTNAVILLLLPFFAGSWPATVAVFRNILRDFKGILLMLLCFAIPVFLQLLVYKLQSDSWWVYSYSEEGFDFTNPEVMNVLFSYRRGLFVYTPLLLVTLFGLFVLRKNKFRLTFMLLFLIINTYIISSWWMWFYGGCYGMRPFVDYYAVFILLFGLLFQALYEKTKRAWVICALLSVPFVYVSLVQTWQYRESVIPYDFVDKEKYWRIFMHTEKQFKYIFMPESKPSSHPVKIPKNATSCFYHKIDFEKQDTLQMFSDRFIKTAGYNSSTAALLNKDKHASPGYFLTLRNYVPDSLKAKTWVRVKAKIFQEQNDHDAAFVTCIQPVHGAVSFWKSPYLIWDHDSRNAWKEVSYIYKLSPRVNPDDVLVIYILKYDNNIVAVDDLEVELFVEK